MTNQIEDGTYLNNYQIKRGDALNIFIRQEKFFVHGSEWNSIGSISKKQIINGKRAIDCSDDELLNDWTNNGRGWSR